MSRPQFAPRISDPSDQAAIARRPGGARRGGIAVAVLCAHLVAATLALAGGPVLRDPGIPDHEMSVYRVLKRDGVAEHSTHRITCEDHERGPVYRIGTDSTSMVLMRSDLTPVSITRLADDGSVDWRLLYRGDRVNYVFPGPRRNRVEKVDDNRYDVNAIAHVVRGFPFGEKDEVKLKLVTMDRIVGVAFKIVGEETASVPAGDFACYKVRVGLTGMKRRLYKRKIHFWVEKAAPHRMVMQEDEGVTEVARIELVEWRVCAEGDQL